MRLIDADALSNAMYHEAFETDSEMQKWDSGCWIRYKMFEKHLEQAPTVTRPTGTWITMVDGDPLTGEPIEVGVYCSKCHCMSGYVSKYCPDCGRLMKRGE